MDATGGPEDSRLDVMRSHRLDGRKERPLIGIRPQIGIDENTETLFPRTLLQRQGNQVSEPAFGHGVLIRKQPVIGSQLQLPSARAGKTDDGGAETPGITG